MSAKNGCKQSGKYEFLFSKPKMLKIYNKTNFWHGNQKKNFSTKKNSIY